MLTGRRAKVLDVGQCGFDHGNITELLEARFGAEVDSARDAVEAERLVAGGGYDLVLVNRILDADGSEGLAVIRRLRSAGEKGQCPPIMLVSNFADAQQQAIAAGAVPGFGKSQLSDAATIDLLGAYLAGDADPDGGGT